jgi:dTDP-4-dehydrorhamnose reductase
VSWHRFAQMAAEAAGLQAGLVQAMPSSALTQVARRPRYSALASERAVLMPTLDHAMARYLGDCVRFAGDWPLRNPALDRAAA